MPCLKPINTGTVVAEQIGSRTPLLDSGQGGAAAALVATLCFNGHTALPCVAIGCLVLNIALHGSEVKQGLTRKRGRKDD